MKTRRKKTDKEAAKAKMSGPDDEVRRLDQRIDEVTDETLDSTRRMLNMAVETNQIGVDTLVTLNEQGPSLEYIQYFVGSRVECITENCTFYSI